VVEELDTTELVRLIIGGDRSAEADFVSRYARAVAILIDRTVRSPSAREDLSQVTFAMALEKIRKGELRQPDRLTAFIFSLARNVAVSHLRNVSKFRDWESTSDAENIPDPAPSPLDEILKKEERRIVEHLLSELKVERDRELLFRYFLRDEDKDKICADLGLTRVQFNHVLHRALARFKELYERRVEDSLNEHK